MPPIKAERITSAYEHSLACAYHRIDGRGIKVDVKRLESLREKVTTEITALCLELSNNWNLHVFMGSGNARKDVPSQLNLNSSSGEKSLLEFLKKRGFDIPVIRKRNQEREYESKESTCTLALRKMFASTGDEDMLRVLRLRELSKLRSTYIDAKLYNETFYCNYNVAGTLTGRRGSSKHIFGVGGNGQNFPKHTKLGKEFQRALISREGKIFLHVDQKSAEDWPVSALAENLLAIDQMLKGINRHKKTASFLFGIPEDTVDKNGTEYFLGKKTRHANNYKMQPPRMSDSLAQLGISMPVVACKALLERMNAYEPNIAGVFHKYIETQLRTKRFLQTPLGRERYFTGLRPNDNNYQVLNEAYAYIPQSIVGDNTGLAVLYLDGCNNYVINEKHDSIASELPDNWGELSSTFQRVREAFDRTITFHNGISVNIPIEAEIGYNFIDTITLKDYTEECLKLAYEELKDTYKPVGV